MKCDNRMARDMFLAFRWRKGTTKPRKVDSLKKKKKGRKQIHPRSLQKGRQSSRLRDCSPVRPRSNLEPKKFKDNKCVVFRPLNPW